MTKPEMKPTFIRILEYLEEHLPQDEVLTWVLQEMPRRGIPQMQITPEQGRFLNLLAQLIQARHILEIGTLSGYSTIWLARALPPDGKLITCEVNPSHAQLAREAIERAQLDGLVEIRVGPALETLAQLTPEPPFDMVFIDADKHHNMDYFQYAEAHTRPGGLILVDNVFLNGQIIAPDANAYMQALEAFNRYVFDKYGQAVTVIPFYKKEEDNLDGIMVVRI